MNHDRATPQAFPQARHAARAEQRRTRKQRARKLVSRKTARDSK